MPIELAASQTCKNLMRAFAGESQARNRYTMAAEMARGQGLHIIEQVFLLTARQELAHAKLFYRHLQPLAGQTIAVDGSYPVDLRPDSAGLLRAAQHNEYQEWEHDYRHFAQVAREEGFDEIAHHFETVADIEKTHGDRFGRFAQLLESGQLFSAEEKVRGVCLNCGHVVEANLPQANCEVCKHPQGYFVRADQPMV